MEHVGEIIKSLADLAIAIAVILNLFKTHEATKKLDAGVVARQDLSKKIDVLTEQTNGMAANLAQGNRAIGAADARRDDAAKLHP